ncbi:MAG TPA: beta-L-arabinofuranosidase domain-containing protein [Planctomycetota bacterium]|nr:beta-L-arabinofuranosidase domain-containing protein [Planctomycetota bacterium]
MTIAAITTAAITTAAMTTAAASAIERRTAVAHDQVRVRGFWGRWQELVRSTTLPAQHRSLLATGRIDAFRLAWKPGQPDEPHIFWDSDTAKWVEAAAHVIASDPASPLAGPLAEVAALIASAQQPDGYLNTHFTVVAPQRRWTDTRNAHELYCAGHLIEAAVAHHRATGDRLLLDVARRLAACIRSVFGVGPGQKRGYCGHEEIELALIALYRATGEREHLELARYFIDERGTSPNWFAQEDDARGVPAAHRWDVASCQASMPVRALTDAHGHAVRAMYLYCGMADVALETGDAALGAALDRLWDNVTQRRMYVTGGVGSRHQGETFGDDYELPNATAYCETCAAIGLVFWAQRMSALRDDGRYADEAERALYNGALAGIALDGTRFFYVNPLASDGTHHRQEWFGCACCPPNIARLIASLGGHAYATDRAGAWVHQYVAGTARLDLAGTPCAIDVATTYPWSGRITITVRPENPVEAVVRLRIPGWCRQAGATIAGEAVDVAGSTRAGYLRIARRWRAGDVIELDLAMPVERLHAHPAVVDDRGRVALRRGPVVYCCEAVDLGIDPDSLTIARGSPLHARHDDGLLGGVTVIEGDGTVVDAAAFTDRLYRADATPTRPRRLLAVPYFAWDNRAPGAMRVWLREG